MVLERRGDKWRDFFKLHSGGFVAARVYALAGGGRQRR
jgi:hypothetical protein